MRTLWIFLFLGLFSTANAMDFTVETHNPRSVCNNTKELVRLLSPYVDIDLLSCDKTLESKGWLGTETYSVEIRLESLVKTCVSAENQAIMFDIPTNTYPHWNPPARYTYLDNILDELGFRSEISVRGVAATGVPSYKQIVLIPECAMKR